MNISRPLSIGAVSALAIVTGMAAAQKKSGISTCNHSCTPSPVTSEVTLRVVVPDTLTFNKNDPNIVWTYTDTTAKKPVSDTTDILVTHTASKP